VEIHISLLNISIYDIKPSECQRSLLEAKMDFSIISINWTAQNLTGEQLLVLRNVAAQHLCRQEKGSTVTFAHWLCDGMITRKSEGTFVTFAGTFFHADLGTVKGERWTVDFLLPRGSEHFICDENTEVLAVRPLKGGDFKATKVNYKQAALPEKHQLS